MPNIEILDVKTAKAKSRVTNNHKKVSKKADIEAATFFSNACRVEFFERDSRNKKFGGKNPKLPDLKLILSGREIFCEVYVPRQRKKFEEEEERAAIKEEIVESITSIWWKHDWEYLMEMIIEKAKQFEQYNPGIIYIDFSKADTIMRSRGTIEKAMLEVWKRKYKSGHILKNLIGVYSCNVNVRDQEFWTLDPNDARSKIVKDAFKID